MRFERVSVRFLFIFWCHLLFSYIFLVSQYLCLVVVLNGKTCLDELVNEIYQAEI
jgi:hypothetical protein